MFYILLLLFNLIVAPIKENTQIQQPVDETVKIIYLVDDDVDAGHGYTNS